MYKAPSVFYKILGSITIYISELVSYSKVLVLFFSANNPKKLKRIPFFKINVIFLHFSVLTYFI